jgi:hypothetical protein
MLQGRNMLRLSSSLSLTIEMLRYTLLSAVAVLFILPSCAPADEDPAEPAEVSPQDTFWSHLEAHCGEAYRGVLVTEPAGDEMLVGDEQLVAHFRACDDDEIRIAFHIEKPDGWDRSRTWVYSRDADGLELRHDHRQPDGTPDDDTWYGGRTQSEGSAEQQEFVFTERTAPDGSLLGWRVQIVPGERYTYGTFRGDEFTWRVDFDLTETVDVPPAAWGYE